jgi:hypothetical protein
VIDPTEPAEREQLRKDCLRHATKLNGIIDGSGSGSDCVFLYATSGTDPKEEVCREIYPFQLSSSDLKSGVLQSPNSRVFEMTCFAKEVRVEYSLYTDVPHINFFRSKLDISSTRNSNSPIFATFILLFIYMCLYVLVCD